MLTWWLPQPIRFRFKNFEYLPWQVFFQIGPKLPQGVALAMDHRWRQLVKLSRLALVLQWVLVVVHLYLLWFEYRSNWWILLDRPFMVFKLALNLIRPTRALYLKTRLAHAAIIWWIATPVVATAIAPLENTSITFNIWQLDVNMIPITAIRISWIVCIS